MAEVGDNAGLVMLIVPLLVPNVMEETVVEGRDVEKSPGLDGVYAPPVDPSMIDDIDVGGSIEDDRDGLVEPPAPLVGVGMDEVVIAGVEVDTTIEVEGKMVVMTVVKTVVIVPVTCVIVVVII